MGTTSMRFMTIRVVLLLAVVLLTASSHRGQSIQNNRPNGASEEVRLEIDSLLSDLRGLESRAAKLDQPFARASAKTEIADAAASLDRNWSMKLLREAYGLTFPEEEEQPNLRDRAIGSAPPAPSPLQIAAIAIRIR